MSDDRPIQHFPDTYSIKAVGKDEDDFAAFVVSVIQQIIGADSAVTHYTRASSKGAYVSVTASFTAVDQQQLDRVFTEMSAQDRVRWVI